MSDKLNNHLVSNIPNTEENRLFVKDINKKAKESKSVWKLKIRYRKPIEGEKYGWGGGLKRENAKAFSVYVEDRRNYDDVPSNKYASKLYSQVCQLEEENDKLKKQLAIYTNPYYEWRTSEIEDELFEMKETIVEDFLANYVSEDHRKIVQNKYNQLMEALEYHAEDNSG